MAQLSAQKTPPGPAFPRKHPRPFMPLGDAVDWPVLVIDNA